MSRLIVKNLPSYISDQRLKEHFSSQGGTITDVKLVHRPDGTSRRFAFVGFKTESDASKARNYFDRTYIDSSRISVLVEASSGDNDDEISDLEWMRRRTAVESPRLFLRNLPYSCTVADLEEAFSPFGQLVQAHIPLDPTAQTAKGMGFVTFASVESAIAAQRAMHRSTFQGRILHAVPAVSRRTNPEFNDKESLRDQRLQKARENASKDFNWSMLYMNSDAVASSVAHRMKISKADILNPDSDDAAVKLALAETHVIQETKKYLEDEGVILDSFKSKQRSDTTILVKNIPYGTAISELTEMFSPHGEITRLLLPPAGTIAVVEFSNPLEAGKAFRAVAYKRLKNSIVYLEKAPAGMFGQDEPGDKRFSSGVKPVVAPSRSTAIMENVAEEGSYPAIHEDDSSSSPVEVGATLFVKNLNFGTTTDKLVKTFQHLPSFAFARVQMKPDPKRPGSNLSMGYGFVGFKDKDAAKKAMTVIDGFVIDGHSLIVKFAQRGVEGTTTGDRAASAKVPTTKVVVKNLPFEATKKDIRTLFGAHGQLKSVRLPKKFNAGSRGFAFLEFTSHKEAENAMTALKHTHLLGRHVVLEWAEDNGDLDALRERVKSGYGDGKSERPGRKRKLDMDILDDGEESLAM